MKLTLSKSQAFSQGKNIEANIKGGWCAGITAVVSRKVGDHSLEIGLSTQDWVEGFAYDKVISTLKNINSISDETHKLQIFLGKVKDKSDVCSDIHTDDYDGRSCKILLSLCSWLPIVGYASYVWNRKWIVNHIGLVVRGGNSLLIFDPNYGVGLFSISDNQPLSLSDLTKAIGELAWLQSAEAYYLSYTTATAVIDAGPLDLRTSIAMKKRIESL
jgi:hypothetical protein